MKRLIVGISGASGAIYGVRLLQVLRDVLLTRAADVVLKERRPLVLCVRETPLHLGHLRLMTQAAEIGAVIMPPVPAFYHRPQSLDDVINQTVNRVLDQFAITLPEDLFARWQGA